MSRRLHKIKGYRIITPKYQKLKVASSETFDIELINYWIYAIEKLSSKAKTVKYKNKSGNGSKHFYLDSILTNNDEYIFGKFKTGSYGTTQEFYDRYTSSQTYVKRENETSDDDVYFYLYKNTGVLLMGNDPNHAINAGMIKKYLSRFEFLLEPYRKQFNRLNDKKKQIYFKRMLTVNSLPPIDFFEEMQNMSKIKEGSFTLNQEDVSDTLDVLKALKEIDDQSGIGSDEVEIEIAIKNKSSKRFVSDFKRLFEVMNQSESFDDLRVVGKHRLGDTRTIRNNMPIRTFECTLEYGTKSYPINEQEVETELHRINTEQKVLFNQVTSTEEVDFVGDIESIKDEINERCEKFNKRFRSFRRYRGELSYKNQ